MLSKEVHILIFCVSVYILERKHVSFYFQLLYMTKYFVKRYNRVRYASKQNTIKKCKMYNFY